MRSLRLKFLYLLAGILIASGAAHAEIPPEKTVEEPFRPALVYISAGTDRDSAFIDAARAGAARARAELGIEYQEFRMTGKEDVSVVIRKAAEGGATPIIAVGFQNVIPVLNLAERYPHTRFTVIDGLVPPIFVNVQSVLFRDHEGAFLVGIVAGVTTRSNKVGFIGGMDIPIIRNFAKGYVQGVRYANPKAEVMVKMLGTTPEAWSNPEAAEDLALSQYEAGADVIFAAAGGSSIGVLRAAKRSDNFAIGVDINQNALFPGHVLTSMVKRVDVAVYNALKTAYEGKWSPGIKYLGLKENALDYAVDEYNRHLMNEELIDKVATARERIVNGLITVEIYTPK
jgi:basic membrane protein A and related proteins